VRFLKKFSLLLLLLLVLPVATYGWYRWQLTPVNQKNAEETIFVVPQGQNATAIGKRLQQEGFIKSSLVFKLVLNRLGYESRLQAGSFRLSQSMDLNTIVESLTHGSLDFWITFREGLRVEEYAEILAEKSDIDAIEFILAAKPFEGQLFPDTYLIPQTASPQDVVDILVLTFERKSPTQDQDTIIIASLIEREARHVQDRLLVSSVLHNRLNLGMALQIDATVQYVIGEKDDWWPNNLTREQLAIKSPYNTYLNAGLPPQPIANPGSDSLEAALNPAETDYLYYLSDSAGFNHYATDLEGHNQNIVEFLK